MDGLCVIPMRNLIHLAAVISYLIGCTAIGFANDAVEKLSSTSWRIRTQLESVLKLESDERHEFHTKEGLVFETEKNHFVTQIEVTKSGSAALLSVFERAKSGGFFYAYIVLVQSEGGETTARKILKAKDLDAIDGRDRRVSAIGSTADFPKVEFSMMFTEKVGLPSKIVREWQIWDVNTSKLIRVTERHSDFSWDMTRFTEYMPTWARERRALSNPQE